MFKSVRSFLQENGEIRWYRERSRPYALHLVGGVYFFAKIPVYTYYQMLTVWLLVGVANRSFYSFANKNKSNERAEVSCAICAKFMILAQSLWLHISRFKVFRGCGGGFSKKPPRLT